MEFKKKNFLVFEKKIFFFLLDNLNYYLLYPKSVASESGKKNVSGLHWEHSFDEFPTQAKQNSGHAIQSREVPSSKCASKQVQSGASSFLLPPQTRQFEAVSEQV
jgi:hypothetical protein